jgi:hypothetical protein
VLVLKLQQLLNFHRFNALTEAVAQRERFQAIAGELTDDKARGRLFKASPAFRDGVDQVLEAIELRAPTAQQGTRASIADVVRELQLDQAGRQSTTNFDEDVIAGLIAQPKPYKDLTIAEMREVDTFLRNVRGTARARTTALKEGKQIDREAAVAELIKEAEANRKNVGPVSSSQSAETLPQRLDRMWTEFDGAGMRPERLAMWMGGNDLNSSWFKLVIDPLQLGKYKKAEMMKKTAAPLHKKLESALKDQRFMKKVNGRELFPTHREDLEAPRYTYEIWMMLVHAGTQSSLDRLTQGRGITELQLRDAVNKHLSKKMVDLAQAVWDANESIWPEAQKLEERQSGVAPPKLELRPFETKWGTLRGGYMAAKYDSRVEQVGEFQAGEALGAVLDQSYVRPGTAKSHLKKRAENFSGALQLEPGLILRVLDPGDPRHRVSRAAAERRRSHLGSEAPEHDASSPRHRPREAVPPVAARRRHAGRCEPQRLVVEHRPGDQEANRAGRARVPHTHRARRPLQLWHWRGPHRARRDAWRHGGVLHAPGRLGHPRVHAEP